MLLYKMGEFREMALFTENLTAKLSFRHFSIKVGWNNPVEGPMDNELHVECIRERHIQDIFVIFYSL